MIFALKIMHKFYITYLHYFSCILYIDFTLNIMYYITINREQTTRTQSWENGEKNMIKFLDLFNTMHCDFFEIQKGRKSEFVEWEMSGKMLQTCKKYFDDRVIDFYITRSNKNNELGLVIRLEEIKK